MTKEEKATYDRQYRKNNAEKIRERRRKWRQVPQNKIREERRERSWQLQKKYGVTIERYEAMLIAQGGVCAICKGPPNGKGSKLGVANYHVDHDHKSGIVRGLLCFKCNQLIGYADDSPERLQAAAKYLMV